MNLKMNSCLGKPAVTTRIGAAVSAVALLFVIGVPVAAQSTKRDTIRAAHITTERIRETAGSRIISPDQVGKIVSPLGEGDAIKFIQTLPGVSTGAEGSSAYYARGGNIGNNVITIDGIPIFGSSHLLGFSSAYSPDIIASTDFKIGGFSSDEGNLTSSHLRLSTKDGDFRKVCGKVSLSNFNTGLSLSFPIAKDKISFIGAVRVSPVGFELRQIQKHI